MRNVYERCVVIELPADPRQAADFLSRDPENVVMDPSEATSTAMTMSSRQPNVSRTTERGKQIMRTAAAWIPLAHCGDLPSMDATVDALTEHADKLLGRMPWLVALAYSLDLPYKKYHTADLPESALEWDMKAHSRQAILCCRAYYWSAFAARERLYVMCTRTIWMCRAPRAAQCRSLPRYCVLGVMLAKWHRHGCCSFACKDGSQACGSIQLVTAKKLAMLWRQPAAFCLLGAFRLEWSSATSPTCSV